MKITLEADYAIRIVDYLVRLGGMAGAADISEAAVVPLRFAKNILQKLVHYGIVTSYKGVRGGYELGRPAEEISLYDVVEATQGPVILNRCLLNSYECTCIPDKKCPYYEIFRQLSGEMEQRMRGIRFAAVVYNR